MGLANWNSSYFILLGGRRLKEIIDREFDNVFSPRYTLSSRTLWQHNWFAFSYWLPTMWPGLVLFNYWADYPIWPVWSWLLLWVWSNPSKSDQWDMGLPVPTRSLLPYRSPNTGTMWAWYLSTRCRWALCILKKSIRHVNNKPWEVFFNRDEWGPPLRHK